VVSRRWLDRYRKLVFIKKDEDESRSSSDYATRLESIDNSDIIREFPEDSFLSDPDEPHLDVLLKPAN
jgi:hypothetical protein